MSDEFNGIEEEASDVEASGVDFEADGIDSSTDTDEKTSKSDKPKKRGKARIIILVIVIVIVLLFGGAGIAYAATHNDPHFCNAICHVPMDAYVESYYEGTSVVEVQSSSSSSSSNSNMVLGAVVHREAEVICLDCHEPDLGEQISEGMKWLTGNYNVPLRPFRIVNGTPKEGTSDKSAVEFCLRSGCHDVTSIEELKKLFTNQERDPHNASHGASNCSDCHKIHEPSVMVCAQCHGDAVVPEGWTHK